MNFRFLASICSIISFLTACNHQEGANNNSIWANSMGIITAEKLDDGSYGYTITYEIPKSIATNSEGKKIKGPIQQHGISQKKPVNNQKIKLKYMKEEPIIFKLIDPLQFET